MAWIESHQELREHPKTKRLCRALALPRPTVVGYLHFLWWWAYDYAPEGDLSAFSDEDIADAVDWEGDPSEFVAALILCGFVNEDRRLHDWEDFAQKWIERRQADRERKRSRRKTESPVRRNSTGDPPEFHSLSGVTGPDLTGPDLTGPDNPSQTLPARGKGSASAGLISQDAVERLSRLPPDLGAASFHAAAEVALSEIGFDCEREVPVAERGDGRSGRVDLVAVRGDERLAIEFDRTTPRSNSVRKLSDFPNATRVVVLRQAYDKSPPVGIDVVIGNALAPPKAERSPPRLAARPRVPDDTSAYFSGEYGQILAARSRTQHTSEEG